MPPKYASQRTSSQREMDELRRQVATIARNMTTLMSIIKPSAVQGQKIEEMSAQLVHLIEAIAQPAPASQPESPTVDEEWVIPRPMMVVGMKYRRTNITKTHIIDRVIKPYRRDADGQELPDAQLKGIYSTGFSRRTLPQILVVRIDRLGFSFFLLQIRIPILVFRFSSSFEIRMKHKWLASQNYSGVKGGEGRLTYSLG
ncbi:hypothetical protein BX666DRAFT_843450 [Dichotomocladium elegans]|nr:hypothetical protein BX666DRAFT_843450 [Dichotomocladium elegans]